MKKGDLWVGLGCLIAGALASRVLVFHPLMLLLPLPGLLFRKRLPPVAWILPLCLVGSLLRMTPGPADLRRLLPDQAISLEMEFVVAGDATPTQSTRGEIEIRAPIWVRSIRYRPEFEAATGRVQIRIPGDSPAGFLPGSRWRAMGRLDPASAPHTGLRGSNWIYSVKTSDVEALPAPPLDSGVLMFFRIRETLTERLRRACEVDPEASEVLQILLLARRGELDELWIRRFAKTGLIHLFAISGLHLGMLTAFLLFFFRRLGLGHRWRWAGVLPVLFLFTACTGFRASALRALIMAGCVLTAPFFNRREHLPTAFAAAACLILAYAPEQLFEIGFLFSFVLVAGLLLAGTLMDRWIGTWIQGDPWAPQGESSIWWQRRRIRPLLGAAAVSALCFVVSAPLTAYHFNLFSPVALLGNLLAVPLAFLLLAAGFAALPALWLMPLEVSRLLILPARLCSRALLEWVSLIEHIPGGVQWVRSPPLWIIVLIYILPPLAVFRPRLRPLCLAALLSLAGYAATEAWLHHHRSEVVVLDADRGQAAWFRNARSEVLLIDAGSDWSGWRLREALQKEGIDHIAACILTHPDRNHVEGIHQILREYTPDMFYAAAPDVGHALFADLQPKALRQGDVLRLAGWRVDVLWPPADVKARAADERSLVLRISDGFASALVMGGANEGVEEQLVAAKSLLPAGVLFAAHSQNKATCSGDFLQEIRPEAVVFSGKGFGGISEWRTESEARVHNAGIPVWRVPDDGFLRIDLRRGSAQ